MNEGRQSNGAPSDGLATALGMFSIGLGLAEVTAPDVVGRILGIRAAERVRMRTLLRGFGMRELVSGLGILSGGNSTRWLWSRVAGDVMDLAFLGTRFRSPGVERARLGAATAAVAAVTALDVVAARQQFAASHGAPHTPRGEAVVTINRPPADVYGFWRQLANVPRFMTHLAAVEETGPHTSHWVVEHLGLRVEWDAEITDDTANERIAWRAIGNADIPNCGHVSFRAAPGGRGTEVRVSMNYEPPAGRIGTLFAQLLGHDPAQQLRMDLRRLKQLLETGEISTTKRQTKGARSLVGRALEPFEIGSQS